MKNWQPQLLLQGNSFLFLFRCEYPGGWMYRTSLTQQTPLIFVVWDRCRTCCFEKQDESPVSESDSKDRHWHVLYQPHEHIAAIQQVDCSDSEGWQ
jgi:hypothetical protein